jgi:hypothetical protein
LCERTCSMYGRDVKCTQMFDRKIRKEETNDTIILKCDLKLWIGCMALDKEPWQALVNRVMNLVGLWKAGNFTPTWTTARLARALYVKFAFSRTGSVPCAYKGCMIYVLANIVQNIFFWGGGGGLEIRDTAVGIHHADHVIPSIRKSRHWRRLTSGSRSAGIVRSQTQATEFNLEGGEMVLC